MNPIRNPSQPEGNAEPSVEARGVAEDIEIVFTDRLHIKAHFHHTLTIQNITRALEAYAARKVAEARRAEREKCIEAIRRVIPDPAVFNIQRGIVGGCHRAIAVIQALPEIKAA